MYLTTGGYNIKTNMKSYIVLYLHNIQIFTIFIFNIALNHYKQFLWQFDGMLSNNTHLFMSLLETS